MDEPAIASPTTGAPGTSADLDRRLARLEHRVGDVARSVESLAPLVAALRDVVGDQLVRLQADIRRTGSVVDAFSAALEAEVAARADHAQGGRPAEGALTALEEAADVAIAAAHRVAARADEERDQIQAVLDAALQRIASASGGAPEDPRPALAELAATVQGALAAQANRIERALTGLRSEVLRDAGTAPDLTALEETIDGWRADTARQEELFAQFAERLDGGIAALADAGEQVTTRIATDLDALLAEQRTTLGSALGDLRDAGVAAAATIDTATAEAAAELARRATAAATQLDEQASATAQVVEVRVAGAAEQIDRLVTSLTGLERVFLGYLEDHDRRAAIERADLVRQFVEQLASGLTRRERRRLARKLEIPEVVEEVDDDVAERLREVVSRSASGSFPLPEERQEAAATNRPVAPRSAASERVSTMSTPPSRSPVGGVSAAAGDDDAPAAAADVVAVTTETASPRAARRPAGATTAVPPAPAVAATTGHDRAPDAPRVQASRRKRPVRDRSTRPGDPAHVRRTLAGVRGLGPAKQSALIDRFGTLDGIRSATDEELLALPGIGPSLVTAIREALA